MRGRLKTPDVHAEVFKQLTDSLKTSQVTDVDFSSCGIGAAALGHLSDWVRDATAALKAITLDGQPISGSTPKYGDWKYGVDKTDADMSGFNLLCEALASSQIEVVSMKSCYLGPQALTPLTEAIKVMAALTEVDVRRNMLDEAVLEQLRAAAPETCKILAD